MEEKLLIVIPCLNEEAYLEKLLRKLVAATQALPARLVVVDGGSRDRTQEIAQKLTQEFPSLTLLSNPKKYQGAAVNLAAARYGQDCTYLLRIDAHAAYPDDYCAALVAEANKTKADSVVVAMEAEGKSWFQRVAALTQNSKLGNGGSAHRLAGGGGHWVDHGHHALMRLDAFRAVGGYDESFSHNEDAELDLRLCKAGRRIWLTDQTLVTYFPRSSPGRLFTQYMNYGDGRARNILKHNLRPKLRQMLPAFVLPALLLMVAAPALPLAALPLVLWSGACLGYGGALALKTRKLGALATGPVAMLMHLGWSFGFWRAMVVPAKGGAA